MTPKEKAKQLTIKMGNIITPEFGDFQWTNAKKCAIVAVDEISYTLHYPKQVKYWDEVKEEVKKL